MICPNGHTHGNDAETMIAKRYGSLGNYPDGNVFLTIEVVGGFEYFNTRPYHNYETWAIGYQVTDGFGQTVVNECLRCALDTLGR